MLSKVSQVELDELVELGPVVAVVVLDPPLDCACTVEPAAILITNAKATLNVSTPMPRTIIDRMMLGTPPMPAPRAGMTKSLKSGLNEPERPRGRSRRGAEPAARPA